MEFVRDSFTDTDGTLLDAHTGESGATWTRHSSSGAGKDYEITDANRIRPDNAAGEAIYYSSGLPASAEYDVSADVVFLGSVSSGYAVGVHGRQQPVEDSHYRLYVNEGSGGQWLFSKRVAGATTALGSFQQSFSPSTTYRATLVLRDAAKVCLVNGVPRISSTDNAITEAGRAGVVCNTGTDFTSDSVGPQLDNLLASDVSGKPHINVLRPAPFAPGIAR